jgi:aspartate aminotransferase
VSDEPYRFLAYDGCRVPPVLPLYPHSVVVGSFSKSLSLAGERVGYVAVNPGMPEALHLVDGVILTNRILGYVNAPALGQRLLVQALGAGVDVKVYDERREAMAAVLRAAGIEFFMPQGAFYFFPRAPGGDDLAWVNRLMAQRILAVPGSGFGFPGFFRLTFCVDRRVIERSADGFLAAARG